MKHKFWSYLLILMISFFLFSDCCKDDKPEDNPCPFSMSHTSRIKCIVTSPANGAILQSTTVTLICAFGGTNPGYSIYLGTSPDTLPKIATQAVNNITLNNLKVSTTYYWKFSANENIECGLGCNSATNSFIIVQDKNLPYVTTAIVPAHINTTSPIGGSVISEGSSPVTERGVYWGRSPEPESTGTKLILGNGAGVFSILLKGLDPLTKYYVKAYASNISGTYFGAENIFNTGQNAVYQSVSDIESNVYKTLAIGTQIWMVENLKTTKFNDGTVIPVITDNIAWSDMTPKFTWHSNDPFTYRDIYGALYNGFAVATGKLCPAGWHVPSDVEWKTLEMYLGMTQNQADSEHDRGTDQGSQLKSTAGWPDQGNGFNTSDFSALPGGFRNPIGTFSDFRIGQWWSSTLDTKYNFLWGRSLIYNNSFVSRGLISMQGGSSVRCIKD
jgi:uncharacterized protein (TIGR02145 family)